MIKQRDLLTTILLSVVTCGIYGIYFWYCYTEDMNKVCQGDGKESPNYIIVLLLGMVTCGFYTYWWYYTQGNRLQAIAPRYNLAFQENGTSILLWILLGSFLCLVGPFVAMHIMIKNMNSIAAVYNSRA